MLNLLIIRSTACRLRLPTRGGGGGDGGGSGGSGISRTAI